MKRTGKILLALLPLVFAFGFLAPVVNQGLIALDWRPPFAINTLTFAFAACGAWGLFACIRGSWL